MNYLEASGCNKGEVKAFSLTESKIETESLPQFQGVIQKISFQGGEHQRWVIAVNNATPYNFLDRGSFLAFAKPNSEPNVAKLYGGEIESLLPLDNGNVVAHTKEYTHRVRDGLTLLHEHVIYVIDGQHFQVTARITFGGLLVSLNDFSVKQADTVIFSATENRPASEAQPIRKKETMHEDTFFVQNVQRKTTYALSVPGMFHPMKKQKESEGNASKSARAARSR